MICKHVSLAWTALIASCCITLGDPAYYLRKSTWQETLQASREALNVELAKQAAAKGPGAAPQMGPWFQIGPFQAKDSFKEAFPPEKEIALAKRYDKLQWQQIASQDGKVHGLSCPGNGAIYFYRKITARGAVSLPSFYGSDDGLAVWLNGKSLLSKKVARGVGANQDRATLPLKAGENHLLIKIWNNGGHCGWYFSTNEKSGGKGDPRSVMRNELWSLLGRDFTDGTARKQMQWEKSDNVWAADWKEGDLANLAARYSTPVRGTRFAAEIATLAGKARTRGDLAKVRELYYRAKTTQEALAKLKGFDMRPLRMAVEDLTKQFPRKYPSSFLKRLDHFEQALASSGDGANVETIARELMAFQREALLSNPLLDFDKLLLVKRKGHHGLPQNWQGNCALPRSGYDNEICALNMRDPDTALQTLYKPEGSRFVGDVDLHFDADRMLFSSTGTNNRWQVFELGADGKDLRKVTLGDYNDVDNYDACYLPDERIIFGSTRCFQGVPCVGGGNQVANLFIMDRDGGNVRRLTFDQDHDWCPTVLNNGRVAYTRWEYSDSPHYFTRILMHMNPDGTRQMELYGSNSYWPNSIFYARPIPGHPSQVIAVISGHHGVPRMGELILFDPAKGRHEAQGVVQRIPGYGKEVEPVIRDGLVNGSWPRFLHPYPLSEKYFLVSCQKNNKEPWDIYLVDVFDNMLKLRSEPGYALLEPVPFRETKRPPVVPDSVDLTRKDSVIYLNDVYKGDGLKGVARGPLKKLRIYELHYAYFRMGGHIHIGIDGPWDVHRIMGTVPVRPDGSALFRIPANTPVAVQPIDQGGKAVQLMRSWFTAMPGEVLSCVGCHENQNSTPPPTISLASQSKPDEVTPWYGPTRGFSFQREVQPVLDRHCVSCHNGQPTKSGKQIADLRRTDKKGHRGFTPSYLALHPYVRRPGPESDYHLLPPAEYHADSSELIQMLRKGHGGVELDDEAWDRLVTWIDLNVPDHGTWTEHRKIAGNIRERRLEMMKLYAAVNADPETVIAAEQNTITPVKPNPPKPPTRTATAAGWPFNADEAAKRQASAAKGGGTTRTVELGEGVNLKMVLVPAGEFVMGDIQGWQDEWPTCKVRIERPFWIGQFEVSNEQYALFDPKHDSRYISIYNKDQGNRGIAANSAKQPVIRISWQRAMAFCDWLSKKTDLKFSLPTEAQWEYACRAGSGETMNYGSVDADFAKHANLADKNVNNLTRRDSPKWIPSIVGVNDGAVVTTSIGRYAANTWGIHDMHGNVAEWTRSVYRPYPYDQGDGRDSASAAGRRVARGGSFYDRPCRARSAFRLDYEPWQGVYNVGFRVVCEAAPQTLVSATTR